MENAWGMKLWLGFTDLQNDYEWNNLTLLRTYEQGSLIRSEGVFSMYKWNMFSALKECQGEKKDNKNYSNCGQRL